MEEVRNNTVRLMVIWKQMFVWMNHPNNSNEPLAGKRFVKITERKTMQDWKCFWNVK